MAVITQRKLSLRTGREGSMHDPYAWTEYCVKINGRNYTLRVGALGYARLMVDGHKVDEGYEKGPGIYSDFERVVEDWERLVGLAFEKFERYYYRAHPHYDDPYGDPSKYI